MWFVLSSGLRVPMFKTVLAALDSAPSGCKSLWWPCLLLLWKVFWLTQTESVSVPERQADVFVCTSCLGHSVRGGGERVQQRTLWGRRTNGNVKKTAGPGGAAVDLSGGSFSLLPKSISLHACRNYKQKDVQTFSTSGRNRFKKQSINRVSIHVPDLILDFFPLRFRRL